ncbi:uncharacterized protein LOC132660185 [Ovis aries]|uniref:uncharacterized protein LOC132660185 n=1 Tax=Ovis aries TaxID=9940 RepID=UPI0029527D57|nr:uncharacterized protein LOC132660185 [Ovis aries]
MRAAGPGRSAHCEPARGRGAEGPGSEGGARLPDWNPLSPPLGRHSPAAARAHLPAAAPGRTIGCPRGAREIELSIHSWACRARAAAAELSPGSLEDARCPPQPKGASPRGLWARTVSAAGSSRGGCERRGLSLGSRCALHGLLEDPQPAVPGLRLERGSSETVRRYQIVSSARVESTNPLEVPVGGEVEGMNILGLVVFAVIFGVALWKLGPERALPICFFSSFSDAPCCWSPGSCGKWWKEEHLLLQTRWPRFKFSVSYSLAM